MSLRYSFRQLFYGKRFHKDRLWNILVDFDERLDELEEGRSEGSDSG